MKKLINLDWYEIKRLVMIDTEVYTLKSNKYSVFLRSDK